MKYLMILTFLFSTQCVGEEKLTQEKCKSVFTLSKSIMSARQSGVSMPEAMEIVKDYSPGKTMVIMAYEKPRFSTGEYKEKAAQDYANIWYLQCVKQISE